VIVSRNPSAVRSAYSITISITSEALNPNYHSVKYLGIVSNSAEKIRLGTKYAKQCYVASSSIRVSVKIDVSVFVHSGRGL
jgi:hypothetical protein